ncbi:MAG: clostripain-related cysteine peptidase [Anaerolineae bacterium]
MNQEANWEVLKGEHHTTPLPRKKWTVAVYMAGDDIPDFLGRTIDSNVVLDLREMKRVGSTSEVNIVVQTDEAREQNCYRYFISKGEDLAADRIEMWRGDIDSGSPDTINHFIYWVARFFPAEHYFLVLWGHGRGHNDEDVYRATRSVGLTTSTRAARSIAREIKPNSGFFSTTRQKLLTNKAQVRGFGYDDTSRQFLDNVEMQGVIDYARQALEQKVDLLGFDACLMSGIEVCYQLRDSAQILIGSQMEEPGDGWPYDAVLKHLLNEPDISPTDLAQAVVAEYADHYADEVVTQSAVNLEAAQSTAMSVSALAEALLTTLSNDTNYRLFRQHMWGNVLTLDRFPRDGCYADLQHFARLLLEIFPNEVALQQAAQEVIKALDAFVVAERHNGPGWEEELSEASGATIYLTDRFRPSERMQNNDYLYTNLAFAKDTLWDEFLASL